MTKSLKIPELGSAHAVVVMEGDLSEGFFEPKAATVTGASGAVLHCDLPEGVRVPEWAIDTTQEPLELSKAKVRTTLAGALDSAKQKLRAQLLDSLRRLESVRVSWDAMAPKGLLVPEEPAPEAALQPSARSRPPRASLTASAGRGCSSGSYIDMRHCANCGSSCCCSAAQHALEAK